MSGSRRDAAMSLVEVLLTLVIISLVVVPIIQVFNTSHRIGHSARRLVEVTMHAQSLLEALAELDDSEFPQLQPGTEEILLTDEPGGNKTGSGRYDDVVELFNRRPLPIEGMSRTIVAKKLPTRELELRIEVEWDSVVGEKRTRQKLALPMLATPRNWQ